MKRRRCFNTLPRALVLSALAIFYIGCALGERSQAPSQASAAEIDPCALVSKKDAEAILGQVVRDARREARTDATSAGTKLTFLGQTTGI